MLYHVFIYSIMLLLSKEERKSRICGSRDILFVVISYDFCLRLANNRNLLHINSPLNTYPELAFLSISHTYQGRL